MLIRTGDQDLSDCLFLILANKQELPTALKPEKIIEKLDLKCIKADRWHASLLCNKWRGIIRRIRMAFFKNINV